MWSRFELFALCYLTAVNSTPQSDKLFGQIGNLGSQSSVADESIQSKSNKIEPLSSTMWPSEFIPTSNNKEGSQHSTGFRGNNQVLKFNSEGSSTFSTVPKEDENSPFGSLPSNTEGSSHTRRTSDNTKTESSLKQSTEETNHSSSRKTSDKHPSELISITEKNQFGRGTEGSNLNQQTFTQENPSSQGIHKCSLIKDSKNNEQNDFLNQCGSENGTTEKEEEKEVCFSHLGCFKMGKPWKSILRPISAPHAPELIQTTIQFYSRANLENPRNITLYPEINMRNAQFDPTKITAIIVHGFSNSGNAPWLKNMKNVYLKKVDANVMIVDWGKGAQLSNYLQVAGNTRVVGKQLGVLIKFLIEKFGANPGKFHLIGHSLGAQICSYTGKEVQGIARLTALDPAQPGFEGFNREVRLDKTDAEFVDVIHTDAKPFIPTLGYGMIAPHGHVDFYMNGGFDQPGCLPPPKKDLPVIKTFLDLAKYPVEVISKAVSCPHGRAYEYLIESFNETDNCIFWGHKADVKNVIKSVSNTVTQGLLTKFTALSPTCSKETCIPVGFATKKSPLRGVFVVTTNSRSPYCISEPGIPPEIPPDGKKQNSFFEKLGKHVGISG